MRLLAGSHLGGYEIIEPVGKGGMGEVYRARDTKLGRDVAIKVLPDEFSQDKERLDRFEREARLLAQINHPNIATLHGLEEHDAQKFLVMELVDGETLAERIARGPIPLDEAIPLFTQIAEGLEAAHERGIIHRDLKPANIKIGLDRKIKILDFGLAKAFLSDTTGPSLSESPTITKGTAVGVILGTAPYMSPEQARGNPVDKRSDIWAFGCCLFEALTGKAAFLGATVTDTIARIVEREPEWNDLPETTASSIRRLLRRCLEKDVQRRMRDAGDARLEIEEAAFAPSEIVAAPKPNTALPWTVAGVLTVVAAFSLWAPWRAGTDMAARVSRSSVLLPATHQMLSGEFDLSPDGSRLVYATRAGQGRELFLRELDGDESMRIPGTQGGRQPFFSPDGEWVGFFADNQLKKVPLNGVGAVTLVDVLNARGGVWTPDGDIIFPASRRSGISRVSADGGTPEVLTTLDRDEGDATHQWPQLLPDGKGILFSASRGSGLVDQARIVAQSFDSGERLVVTRGSHFRALPTGHLIYARAQTLFAASFDLDRMELTGAGVPVQTGVWTPGPLVGGRSAFAVSDTGTLVYRPSDAGLRRLFLVDLEGSSEALAAPPLNYEQARFSPDGGRLALTTDDGKVYLFELNNDRSSLLTSQFEDASGIEWTPLGTVAWSPDGEHLALDALTSEKTGNLFVFAIDRSEAPEGLLERSHIPFLAGWSPDGTRVLYVDYDFESQIPTHYDVREVFFETGSARRVFESPRHQQHPNLSPNGLWLAYSSERSGRQEVYARQHGGGGAEHQISADGGQGPVWAPDGRKIYYRSGDKMMLVDVTTGSTLSVGRPKILFEGPYDLGENWKPRIYDLSPDGTRFVMIQSEEPPAPQFKLVQNWFEELKRLVPTQN